MIKVDFLNAINVCEFKSNTFILRINNELTKIDTK